MITMRKKYLFGIIIIVLFLVVLGVYKVFKPHQNVSGEDAVASLSAQNLYHEFQTDENTANKKWVGKVIEVSGIISSLNESASYVSINLKAATDGGVNCSVLKTDLGSADKFKAGDSITIKGKCTGFLMDVNLVDCVIKK
jgi:tRNA_anti-like